MSKIFWVSNFFFFFLPSTSSLCSLSGFRVVMPARTVSLWKHLRMSLKVTNELTYSRGSLVLFFTHWGCLDLEQAIKMICTSNTLLLLKEMKAKAKKKTKKTKAYTVQLETWQNVSICFEVLQKKMYLRVCTVCVFLSVILGASETCPWWNGSEPD